MEHVEYVAGFLFDDEGNRIVLIEKQRPAWQRGKWNGVGGHVEAGESPAHAMRREFKEEIGVDVQGWQHFATLRGENDVAWTVHFFCAFSTFDFHLVEGSGEVTDERMLSLIVRTIDYTRTIPNLRWLIPMALSMGHEAAQRFTVTEHYTTSPFTAHDGSDGQSMSLTAPV